MGDMIRAALLILALFIFAAVVGNLLGVLVVTLWP